MDNPEKRATYGAQDEDKQNKNTTHTYNVNNTWAILQTTRGKDDSNIGSAHFWVVIYKYGFNERQLLTY
jgi:hypothetical protein